MSWLSSAFGLDKTPHTSVDGQLKGAVQQQGEYAGQDRSQYLNILQGGQNALNTSISSAVSAAMPSFMKTLQGVNESAVRRGISTGDLGTSYEGDTASAFQRNIANAAGSQALNLYDTQLGSAGNLYSADTNRFLSGMQGQQNYEQQQQAYKRQRSAGLFGGLGAAVGGYFGGSTGAQIGGAVGQGIGG